MMVRGRREIPNSILKEEQKLLTGLVARYSPSGAEEEAVEYLVESVAHRGLRTYVDEAGNACVEWGTGTTTLCLLGHIDTVPGKLPVTVQDDTLTGRGSVDAKGPLAALASALLRVARRCEEPDDLSILLVGAVEEEAASSKGARHLTARLTDSRVPCCTVIGEPSGWNKVTLGYRGHVRGKLIVRSATAHSASNQPTAPEAALEQWKLITGFAEQYNGKEAENCGRRTPFYRLSPTLLSFESQSDGFFDSANLEFGVRLPPEWTPERLKEHLYKLVDGKLQFWAEEKAHVAERNTRLVRAFLSAIRKAEGRPKFSLKTGTSDMNVVAPVWKTPIVAYGPGDPELSHTSTERLDLAQYRQAVTVLEGVLLEFINGE